MALLGYRMDALRGLLRARWLGCWGLSVGAGAQIHPGARLRHGGGSSVGARTRLYRDVQILATQGGSFQIGQDAHVAPGAYVLVGGQQLMIGDETAIGPGLMLFCESNATAGDGPFRERYERADVRIGRNVFVGARVTVLPGARIEDDVVVAAHSVVRGHLASGWIYGGCPARPLRRIDSAGSTA